MDRTKVWGLVPARGGSKSIPYKNLAPLAGRPILDYGILAAREYKKLDRIICSTDDERIADRARFLGIETDRRPDMLAGDDVAVADVARELLARVGGDVELVVLIQPTSPFLLPEHIGKLLSAMDDEPAGRSGQTITPVPHNHHAWNQRIVNDMHVRFQFAAERASAYNKQRKPQLYTFGNLVAARSEAILSGDSFFAEPSIAVDIPSPYDLDVDTEPDLKLAEAIINGGLVKLPHMKPGSKVFSPYERC